MRKFSTKREEDNPPLYGPSVQLGSYNSIIEAEKDKPQFLRILHDIDLVVSPGQIVGVVGAVGAGKSSLIRAIMNEVELIFRHKVSFRPCITF